MTLAHEIGHVVSIVEARLENLDPSLVKNMAYTVLKNMGIVFRRNKHLANKLRNEAKRLSLLWRPMPQDAPEEHKAYRDSIAEIWADVFSVILVNPEFARKNAPNIYRNFFDNMPDKTREAWNHVKDALSGDLEEIGKQTRQALDEMEENIISSASEREQIEEGVKKAAWWRPNVDRFMIKYFGRGHKTRRLGRQAEREGRENIAHRLDQDANRDSILGELFNPIVMRLNDNGLSESQFQRLAFLLRVQQGDPTIRHRSIRSRPQEAQGCARPGEEAGRVSTRSGTRRT